MTTVLLESDEPTCVAPHEAPPTTDALVLECLPLVHHHVRGLLARVPAHVDRNELVSAGMLALATCAAKYDPTVGTTFGQFASARIRGALLDELRSMDWASRSARSKARELSLAQERLEQTLARRATEDELAQAMGISRRALATIRTDADRAEIVSLHTLTPDDSDTLPSDDRGPEGAVLHREQLGALAGAIAELPVRLRTVVEQHFFAQRKLVDIAVDLGVTESRVSQLRSRALVILRDLLADRPEDTTAEDTSERLPALPNTLTAVGGRARRSVRPAARDRGPGSLAVAR